MRSFVLLNLCSVLLVQNVFCQNYGNFNGQPITNNVGNSVVTNTIGLNNMAGNTGVSLANNPGVNLASSSINVANNRPTNVAGNGVYTGTNLANNPGVSLANSGINRATNVAGNNVISKIDINNLAGNYGVSMANGPTISLANSQISVTGNEASNVIGNSVVSNNIGINQAANGITQNNLGYGNPNLIVSNANTQNVATNAVGVQLAGSARNYEVNGVPQLRVGEVELVSGRPNYPEQMPVIGYVTFEGYLPADGIVSVANPCSCST